MCTGVPVAIFNSPSFAIASAAIAAKPFSTLDNAGCSNARARALLQLRSCLTNNYGGNTGSAWPTFLNEQIDLQWIGPVQVGERVLGHSRAIGFVLWLRDGPRCRNPRRQ